MATNTAKTTTQAGTTDSVVAERVARLTALSESSPEAAREEGWAWTAELGRRARRDRGQALEELGELFRAGTPATAIDDRGHACRAPQPARLLRAQV